MSAPWKPQHGLGDTDVLLFGENMPHELEVRLVNDRMQRVYKNLWPSIRTFFLWATEAHGEGTTIIYEGRYISFRKLREDAVQAAAVFQQLYKIKKGDRVGICSRNHPLYIVALFAATLIGAIPTLVNSYLPLSGLQHCLEHTGCKLIILDPERANILEPVASKISKKIDTVGFLVIASHEGKRRWKGMQSWEEVMNKNSGDTLRALADDPDIQPEDSGMILFTSGTTGVPKGVLQSQRAVLTMVLNTIFPGMRAKLRKGESLEPEEGVPQKGCILATPLFHVTGMSILMNALSMGLKTVLMRRWDMDEAVRLIKQENVQAIGGVPSLVIDLISSSLAGHPVESLAVGGAPASHLLPGQSAKAFPNSRISQAYGSTETMATCIAIAGDDYLGAPASTGVTCPINDVLIVSADGVALPAGQVGEIWLRGPNVMIGYWDDPKATEKALTKDGWFKTGDIGTVDKNGFLYVKDRIKDIIIRGGENVDSVAVENALYEADERVWEAAAVGVPDKRLGELVTAIINTRPAYRGQLNEKELLDAVQRKKLLPSFAMPVMIVVVHEELEKTPSQKIQKASLRKLAAKEWQSRQKKQSSAKL